MLKAWSPKTSQDGASPLSQGKTKAAQSIRSVQSIRSQPTVILLYPFQWDCFEREIGPEELEIPHADTKPRAEIPHADTKPRASLSHHQ